MTALSPVAFGVKGDGTTDDGPALNTMGASVTSNTRIVFPARNYKIATSVIWNLAGLSNIEIDMRGASFTVTSAVTGAAFTIQGTEGSTVALTANAAQYATSLTVAAGNEAQFTPAAWPAEDPLLRLGSTAVYDPQKQNTQIGELAYVKSTASGTIGLQAPVAGGAYNTADTAVVSLITPAANINLYGGSWVGAGATSGLAQIAVALDKCVDSKVDGTRFNGFNSAGLQLYDCVNTNWVNGTAEHCVDVNLGVGYGIAINYASMDCGASNCRMRYCRHGFATGGGASRKGLPRRITCHNNRIFGTTDDGIDAHAATEAMTVTSNHVYGAGNNGIALLCSQVTISDNQVVDPVHIGIEVQNFTVTPTANIITANRVRNSGTIGIYVRTDALEATGGAIPAMAGTVVNDNQVNNAGAQSILVQTSAGDTVPIDTVTICGNAIDNPANNTVLSVLGAVSQISVTGNVINSVPTGVSGALFLSTVTNGAVAGNVVSFASLTTGTGIYLATCSNVAVSGNKVNNANTGIFLQDSTTTNCTVVGNDVQNCTNHVAIGTSTTGNYVAANHRTTNTAPSSVTPGASPWTYQNLDQRPEVLLISGGTVSAISYSRDGASFFSTGVIAGPFAVDVGDSLKVTYTVAPTVEKILSS